MGTTDTADADGRRGSNVYEVNTWLWMFALGKPCLGGGIYAEETALKKRVVRVEQPSVQLRLIGVGKLLEHRQNEVSLMYLHVPVCTCIF